MTRPRPQRKRDLQGLLGDSAADLSQPLMPDRTLATERLRPGAFQPRREFDAAHLEALARSIQDHGVLQPLLVRPTGDGFEIVAGERRWRAAQMAGLTELPVLVREMSEGEARRLALIENLQRDDLNTLDEVDAKLELVAQALGVTPLQARGRLMQMLREERGPDHALLEDLFAGLGEQWTSFTRNKLKILNWPSGLLAAVRGGLPYTAAQLIAQVGEEHHDRLIGLVRAGATRTELQGEVRRIRQSSRPSEPAARVASKLGSARWLAGLSAGEKKDLESWLAKMPASVRKKMES